LAVRTRSNRNVRAWLALLAGLVAAAALPGSIAVSQTLRPWKLLASFGAIPVAALAGIVAILLARGASRKIELTLGRARGAGAARAARLLGILGLYLAATGLLTVGVYFLLSRYVSR
jgi:hypothetical protein